MQNRVIYKLSDSVIAQIVRLIQLGMLTGTDVSDHMRQIRMEPSPAGDGNLNLTPEYIEKDKADIESQLDQIEELLDATSAKA